MILFWIILFFILELYIIVTSTIKDPLFESIELPKEYKWFGGLFLSGFLLWIYYPLKNRVIYKLDKN